MNEFVFCIVCHSPRDMSADGSVEQCEHCGDSEYIRSDFYIPDGKPFYGYIEPNTAAVGRFVRRNEYIEKVSKRNQLS